MAIFHFDVSYFSRGRGQAVIAAAAYRSGERLHDRYYGEIHDFTVKGGIIHTKILLPPNAPQEYSHRETLWNEVEFREENSTQRTKARLAREIEGALPIELTTKEQIQLVEEYALANFVECGMCADIAIHDKNNGNPHFHCLLTTRNVSENGFGNKNRQWDKQDYLEQWRREWAKIQNRELERRGVDPVSHESYAVQDFGRAIERQPTIHLGHRIKILERYGETDRGNEYRAIVERKQECEERKRQRELEHTRNRGGGRSR